MAWYKEDGSIGTAAEFGMGMNGMPAPPGYSETSPGSTFVKIGVGELRKPIKHEFSKSGPGGEYLYQFYFPYEIARLFPWKVTQGSGWILFAQESPEVNGFRYRFIRRISLTLEPPGFLMDLTLQNLGTKIIRQTYYDHNFVNVDHESIVNWSMEYPFMIQAIRSEGESNLFRIWDRILLRSNQMPDFYVIKTPC
jgi:hypothetical protein